MKTPSSITLTQYDGSSLKLNAKPKNIVSLVPSITENLILFGKMPVARTSFCIEPKEAVKSIPVIGGTKTPRVSKIISMKPDLVIANQEENIKEHIEEIQAAGIPVWVNFPKKVPDLIPLLEEVASLCENNSVSKLWIEKSKKMLDQKFTWKSKPKIATLIWKNPWMAVGKDTYTSDLIEFCGGENPFEGRYPEITVESMKKAKPDILLLPTEPYEFEHEDLEFWKQHVPHVMSFCGEDLLWSGTRLLAAVDSLTEICKRFDEKRLK